VRLNSELSIALDKLRRLRDDESHALEAERLACAERDYILKTHLSASTRLLCFKKVHKKVRLKEFRLIKQGLYELESKNKKKILI